MSLWLERLWGSARRYPRSDTATLVRQARPHDYIVDDMHRLKTSNYYSVQQRNYAELPGYLPRSAGTRRIKKNMPKMRSAPKEIAVFQAGGSNGCRLLAPVRRSNWLRLQSANE
jgi:hypothetical protein